MWSQECKGQVYKVQLGALGPGWLEIGIADNAIAGQVHEEVVQQLQHPGEQLK